MTLVFVLNLPYFIIIIIIIIIMNSSVFTITTALMIWVSPWQLWTVFTLPGNIKREIADVTSLYITLCDRLQMGMRAKDELYPDLKCLSDVLDRMSNLPSDFEGKSKIDMWWAVLTMLYWWIAYNIIRTFILLMSYWIELVAVIFYSYF